MDAVKWMEYSKNAEKEVEKTFQSLEFWEFKNDNSYTGLTKEVLQYLNPTENEDFY
jgi:hypothetical protein